MYYRVVKKLIFLLVLIGFNELKDDAENNYISASFTWVRNFGNRVFNVEQDGVDVNLSDGFI